MVHGFGNFLAFLLSWNRFLCLRCVFTSSKLIFVIRVRRIGYAVGVVNADGLVLKHQAISSYSADQCLIMPPVVYSSHWVNSWNASRFQLHLMKKQIFRIINGLRKHDENMSCLLSELCLPMACHLARISAGKVMTNCRYCICKVHILLSIKLMKDSITC